MGEPALLWLRAGPAPAQSHDPLPHALRDADGLGPLETRVLLLYWLADSAACASASTDLRVASFGPRWVGVQTLGSWASLACPLAPSRVWIDDACWLTEQTPRQLARLAQPGTEVAWPDGLAMRANALDWASAGFLPKGQSQVLARKSMGRILDSRLHAVRDALPHTVHVVGAGLAGHALMARLHQCLPSSVELRWWDLDEPDPLPGSKQPVLLEHPHISSDDNPMAQLSRAAQRALRDWHGPGIQSRGRLQQAQDAEQARQWHEAVQRLGPLEPACDMRWLEPETAQSLAGWPAPWGGLWWPQARAIHPAQWFATVQERVNERPRPIPRSAIDRELERPEANTLWIIALGGRSFSLARLARLGTWANAHAVAGASTVYPAPDCSLPTCALGGLGSALGLDDGRVLVGASYCEPAEMMRLDHAQGNALRFSTMTGLALGAQGENALGQRLAVRDHLPVIGFVPDTDAVYEQADAFRRNARLPIALLPHLAVACGFGSRGVLWSALAADVLTAQILGVPVGLAPSLQAAIAPQRFARVGLRAAQHREREGWPYNDASASMA